MPSWFHGMPAILASVAAFVTIVGGIMGTLVAFGVIGGNGTIQASPGQEVTISVENVNVSELRITNDIDVSVRIDFVLANESQLRFTVPDDLNPGKYNIQFKTASGDIVPTDRQLEISSPQPIATPTPPPQVRFPAERPEPTNTAIPTPQFPTFTPAALVPPATPTAIPPTPMATPIPTRPLAQIPLVDDDHGDFPVNATHISLHTTVPGSIETVRDADYLSFSAQKGFKYAIEGWEGVDIYYSLYDQDGVTRLASWNPPRRTWTAPDSGTYFIKVRAYSDEETGSYTVTVVESLFPPPTR